MTKLTDLDQSASLEVPDLDPALLASCDDLWLTQSHSDHSTSVLKRPVAPLTVYIPYCKHNIGMNSNNSPTNMGKYKK